LKTADIIALASLAGLWIGCGLSSYRLFGVLFPEMLRHERAHTAHLALAYVDRLDGRDLSDLRRRFVLLAKNMTLDYSPTVASPWWGVLRGPLDTTSEAAVAEHREADRLLDEVRTKLSELCRAAPDPVAYRSACSP
jgi:hypothetical protein